MKGILISEMDKRIKKEEVEDEKMRVIININQIKTYINYNQLY